MIASMCNLHVDHDVTVLEISMIRTCVSVKKKKILQVSVKSRDDFEQDDFPAVVVKE